MKFLLGKKIEMTQIFDEEGNVIPVTLVEAGPCWVTQIKKKEKDKYEAIQLGFENLKEKKIIKTKKKKPYRYLKEFKIQKQPSGESASRPAKFKIGDKIDISVFKKGGKVKISGISKGKGFAGAVKKWGFRGRSSSHGTKHEERSIGSVGRRFPQRVTKGRKMAGRLGSERITIKNLKIIKVDIENNLLALEGAVPGRKGTLLEIRA